MIKLAYIFIILSFFIGCSTEPRKDEMVEYIVKVDSLTHSSYLSKYDTIKIKLYGIIGPDGCQSFSHIEDKKQPLHLDLTVWGKSISSNTCPAVMVYLDGKEYKTLATQSGVYKIIIHQPDRSILVDSLIIK